VSSGRGSESNLFDQVSVRRLEETTPVSSFLLGARSLLQSAGRCFCDREITAPRGQSKSEFKVGFSDFAEENSEHQHKNIKSEKDVAEPTGAPSSVPSATRSRYMMPPQMPTVTPNPLSSAMPSRKIILGHRSLQGQLLSSRLLQNLQFLSPLPKKYRWSLTHL
jgi:hypothetical protein